MMERKLLTPWSRQMTSRGGCPVAAGFTFSPVTLRFARACAVSFTSMVFDKKRGACPWLLAPIGAGPDPPGDVPRSVIAKACSADKRSKDTAITNTTLLRYLVFIFSPHYGTDRNLLFHGQGKLMRFVGLVNRVFTLFRATEIADSLSWVCSSAGCDRMNRSRSSRQTVSCSGRATKTKNSRCAARRLAKPAPPPRLREGFEANVAARRIHRVGRSTSPNANRRRKVRLFCIHHDDGGGRRLLHFDWRNSVWFPCQPNQQSAYQRHIGPGLVGLPGPEPGFMSSIY